MNFTASLISGIAALSISLFASVGGLFSTSAPAASFSVSTPNPAALSLVQFTDTTAGGPTSWAWDFGDGGTSTDRNPAHVYASPGSFSARLTASNASGPASATLPVTVTDSGVLRLNAAHSFDLTLSARDPRTGNAGAGKVIGQNDVYGYFSLPTLSGNAGNPEIIVKMVDATGIGQNYWVFYGSMTDLEFTLSVKENATGVVKSYRKDDSKPSGQFDTSGFLAAATTPTPGAPAPTATPTPPPGSTALQTIEIDVSQYRYSPGTGNPIQVTAGAPTTLVFNALDVTHGFSGIPALGIAGSSNINPGSDGDPYGGGTTPVPYRVTFTAPLSERGKSYSFSCNARPECGAGHSTMLGVLRVN
ncbi:MAG: PKD domain-containing protein [Acidobacteriota bacterium]